MELSADEPTIFLISGVHTKPKPKTNPNPKLRGSFLGMGLGLGLVFLLILGFVLVVYSTGQKYRWLIFLVVLYLVHSAVYPRLFRPISSNAASSR